jgi:GT2 family glycosyltransferase
VLAGERPKAGAGAAGEDDRSHRVSQISHDRVFIVLPEGDNDRLTDIQDTNLLSRAFYLAPKVVPTQRSRVAVLTVNYRTRMQTLRCLESLRASEIPPDRIFILDNSEVDDGLKSAMHSLEPFQSTEVIFITAEKNLGFAEGSNVLIEEALKHADCECVLLLNNDAVAMPRLIGELRAALAANPTAGLAGPRVHKLENPNEIDSLGIVLYRSLMPADRYDINEPYLGPSGGCAMITRECLTTLEEAAGYFFDGRFFCYCEDTDLVLRANLLGYQPVFVNEVLALHEGQASSSKGFNPFIAYHSLRNSTWLVIKLIPTQLLSKYGILHLVAHLMTFSNHLAHGRISLVCDVYRDIFKGVQNIAAGRKVAAPNKNKSVQLERAIAHRFYREHYLSNAAKDAAKNLKNRLASVLRRCP